MFGNDNIICCLLPNKCNLYNQPALVQISTFVFFSLNVVFIIFILVMTICSLQLIWNQYIKTIVADLVCPNDSPMGFDDVTSEDEVHTMMDNCVDTYSYYDHDNCIVFKEKSKFNYMNDTESKSNTCLVCKENNEVMTKVYSNQKRKGYDMDITCTNNKYSLASKINIIPFCITTNIQQYDGELCSFSMSNTSCWPLIKRIYKL